MSLIINPDKFVVPYAVTVENAETFVFHIKDGRPKSKELVCPYCKSAVSFVSEGDRRAAHFRHHDRSACDEKAHYLRKTIHDDVVKATIDILNGRYFAKDICKGQEGMRLPTGFAEREKQTVIDGLKPYRPDITVSPADGQVSAILELEVIWSHKPTPERLQAAASAGRAVGVLDATRIERSYIQRAHLNERFDLPEAIKDYILKERYSILSDRHIKRAISGILDARAYKKAHVLDEHKNAKSGSTFIDTRQQYNPARYKRAQVKQPPPEVLAARKPAPAPKPYTPPKPAPKPRQVMPQGDPNDRANAVLGDLRKCNTEAEITATLARYEDCIEGLKTVAPVRVIHIENLAAYKRKPLAQAW